MWWKISVHFMVGKSGVEEDVGQMEIKGPVMNLRGGMRES